MGSLSGFLHRPLTAAAAVAVTAVSADLTNRLPHPKSSDPPSLTKPSITTSSNSAEGSKSWVPRVSVSNLSNLSSAWRFPLSVPNSSLHSTPNFLFGSLSASVTSPPVLLSLYQSANLAKHAQRAEFTSSTPSEVLYRWHSPDTEAHVVSGNPDCLSEKSRTVVVLLGWLGAKQRHLKRYADWYTSRGFHAVTFTFPMADIISYQLGGKAEQQLDLLVNHLASWVGEEHGKNLVFHTFSNTGWLTYGVLLEKFQKQDPSLTERIKGCIVDSAPVAAPDPQVWASGFSAAFLKKQSIATKGLLNSNDSGVEVLVGTQTAVEPKPAVAEAALLVVLEKFFEVVLNLPPVNRRLSDVLDRLSLEQPKCPQLYIYSSADRVIPVKSVESFIEDQRRAGHEVRACDFVSSPHVDHFRNHPSLYTSQLTAFLEDCVLAPCKGSAPP
ncbi:uncharacterized protein LOC131242887 [Magnolia sinica]|uniref:uncharacterized protein LOC131242887 n=1 Tax=Magnolia sinica TaxID=86752 RepID=UPI002659B1AF|nr:uncharacterized protein LOC131242887 [Magnolia sinica]XP_058097823.1 uncharacterized protein LOC131242887 [Magnolia sinica]XP_058097824.1 uncharacterized protein LOC131242887 [Magnolia sinica]